MPHYPKKRFGQHFLHDENVIEKIIAAIGVKPSDNLLEIGPGLGALTTSLLPLVEKLTVIELDRDVIPRLQENCCAYADRLRIYQQDVLQFDFSQLEPKNNLRLVGNLPYNISTPIIFQLIKFAPQIKDMHFMLQLEVAKRLTAKPNCGIALASKEEKLKSDGSDPSSLTLDAKPSCERPEFTWCVNEEREQRRRQSIKLKSDGSSTKDYGRLSIMAQYTWHAELLFTVDREAFSPPPQVKSAVVRLTPVGAREVSALNYETFADVVRTAFNHRRKTLHNCLKNYVSNTELQTLNIDPQSRPEQISLDNFVRISNILYANKLNVGEK